MSESPPPSSGSARPTGVPQGAGGAPERVLLVLACLFALLRFWRLGEWSLWIDEAYTFADWKFSLDGGQIWNPLGYVAIGQTVAFLGGHADEFSLRLLPAIVGCSCIPLTWWAFRDTLGGRRAALVALVLAVSSWHIFWSQSARFYTMAMALSLLGSGIALRGLWRGKLVRSSIGLAVAAAAAAFHPTAALVAAGLCFAPLLVRLRSPELQQKAGRAASAIGLFALLAALIASPWFISALRQHQENKPTSALLSGPLHLGLTVGYFYTPLLSVLALVGALWAWWRRDIVGLFATAVVLVALGGALVLSLAMQMTAQYTFSLLPWVIFVAVVPYGRERGWAGSPLASFGWPALLVLPALAGTALYFSSRGGERSRWREAYEWVDDEREPGDLILGHAAPIGEFYLGDADRDPRRPRALSPLGFWFGEGARRWNRKDRRVWVVIRPQWLPQLSERDRASLTTWLAEDCRLMRRFPVLMDGRDLELLVYLRDEDR